MKIKKPFFLIFTLILAIIVGLMISRYFVLIISCFFISYMIRPFYKVLKTLIDELDLDDKDDVKDMFFNE